jgi:methyl-accepting chemotaxis protein
MTFAANFFPPAHRSNPRDTLVPVLRSVETCFVSTGESLAAAVDTLRDTKSVFAQLDTALDEKAAQNFSDLSARVFAKVEQLRTEAGQVLGQNADLRRAVRDVRVDVADLDRVVRTIANVSVNARILGNALIPPHPQVNSFVVRLAQMSAEAETILAEIKEAMSGIGAQALALEESLQCLRVTLARDLLPSLGNFATIAQAVQDGRPELNAGTASLAAQMKSVSSEVSRLVVALQSGDSTRQRLERVQDVLHHASGQDKGFESLLYKLAHALLQAAQQDAAQEVDVSIPALEAVGSTAQSALMQARHFYFANAGQAAAGDAAEAHKVLDAGFAQARSHLNAMRARAEAMGEHLEIILRHESTIRQIAQQVRLSGLNAVLICAKLGEEGRGLRELAQWLRALTDESDQIVAGLQKNLAQTRQSVRDVGEVGVDHLRQSLADFLADALELKASMGQIGQTVSDAARAFDTAGRVLPVHIGQAVAKLTKFRDDLADLQSVSDDLAQRANRAALPLHDFGAGTKEAECLAVLRGRYTMQQERAIHDAVVTVGQSHAEKPAAPAALAEEETLDDILF